MVDDVLFNCSRHTQSAIFLRINSLGIEHLWSFVVLNLLKRLTCNLTGGGLCWQNHLLSLLEYKLCSCHGNFMTDLRHSNNYHQLDATAVARFCVVSYSGILFGLCVCVCKWFGCCPHFCIEFHEILHRARTRGRFNTRCSKTYQK